MCHRARRVGAVSAARLRSRAAAEHSWRHLATARRRSSLPLPLQRWLPPGPGVLSPQDPGEEKRLELIPAVWGKTEGCQELELWEDVTPGQE